MPGSWSVSRRKIFRAARWPASRSNGNGKSVLSSWAAATIARRVSWLDFIAARPSTSLGSVVPSYKPGVTPTDLSTALPDYVVEAIREALPEIDKKINGFAMYDAVLTGVETRTSSPIRVKRRDNYQSMNIGGLYPAGEGAGYAGGIYSAAIDGIEVAEALALSIMGA